MVIENGDFVLYERPAKIGENNIPTLVITILRVKSVINNGKQFLDKDDNILDTYRVSHIYHDNERIENPEYDFKRICEEQEEIQSKKELNKILEKLNKIFDEPLIKELGFNINKTDNIELCVDNILYIIASISNRLKNKENEYDNIKKICEKQSESLFSFYNKLEDIVVKNPNFIKEIFKND